MIPAPATVTSVTVVDVTMNDAKVTWVAADGLVDNYTVSLTLPAASPQPPSVDKGNVIDRVVVCTSP